MNTIIIYSRLQIGFYKDDEECEWRTVEFANEMERVDSTIQLVVVDIEYRSWMECDMIRIVGEYLDYLSFHAYISTNQQGKMVKILLLSPWR